MEIKNESPQETPAELEKVDTAETTENETSEAVSTDEKLYEVTDDAETEKGEAVVNKTTEKPKRGRPKKKKETPIVESNDESKEQENEDEPADESKEDEATKGELNEQDNAPDEVETNEDEQEQTPAELEKELRLKVGGQFKELIANMEKLVELQGESKFRSKAKFARAKKGLIKMEKSLKFEE